MTRSELPEFRRGRCPAILLSCLVAACSGKDSPGQPVPTPGAEPTAKTRALETGAAILQSARPPGALNVYVNGFHFHNGDMGLQLEAHHYCAVLNEEVIQCALYDGQTNDARLTGVEYIISGRLFDSLPETEKAYWHSHSFEVTSGQLIAPGIPAVAERELMEKLAGTYGKVWHLWGTADGAVLPLGPPVLMMGFTAEGQVRPGLVAARNQRFGVTEQALQADRKDITPPPVHPGANAWEDGLVVQVREERRTATAPLPSGEEAGTDAGRPPGESGDGEPATPVPSAESPPAP